MGEQANHVHLKVIVQLQRLEVLEFTQIPELHRRIISGRGQVVTILRERDAGDGAGVAREVGHIGAFLRKTDRRSPLAGREQ